MGNVTNVKSKYFEPDGVDANQVSASGSATTLVIADGGPYGNLTETITLTSRRIIVEILSRLQELMEMEMLKQRIFQVLMQVL